MDNRRHGLLNFKWVVFISFFLVLAMTLSSCEPLRKKFTRKKKGEAVENMEVPILEPIEYPKKVYTSLDLYKNHFTFWRAWHKELMQSIVDEQSTKRKLYLLAQDVAQLTEMQKLLTEEKQAPLKDAVERLARFRTDVESPVPSRDASAWKVELESIDKKIRKDFTADKMKDSLQ